MISAVLAAAAATSSLASLITSMRTYRVIAQSKPARRPRQKRPIAAAYSDAAAQQANQKSIDFMTTPPTE